MKTECTIISAPLPLQPGTYRLTEDVKNPKPDRRCHQKRLTTWESWEVWPTGMQFIVDIENSQGMINSGMNRIYPWGGFYKVGRMDSRFPSLFPYLEPVEETPSQFLARHAGGSGAGQCALVVLDKLNIPLSDLQKALDAINKEEEDS